MKIYKRFFEKTFDLDKDVDMLYNRYLKSPIQAILDMKNPNEDPDSFFDKFLGTALSGDLVSKDAVEAHQINPIIIQFRISTGSSHYKPDDNFIAIVPNWHVVNVLYQKGSMRQAIQYIKDTNGVNVAKEFAREFSESRLKGIIQHELSHWISDTLYNRHIATKIHKAKEYGHNDLTKVLKKANVNASYVEVDAQIHAIKQLKRSLGARYDNLTWDMLMRKIPSLGGIERKLNSSEVKQWRRDLISRMSREGLLGKNIRI